MRIVVDAMGGDHAPEVVVEGAIQAARECRVASVLVGDLARVRPLAEAAAGGPAELGRLDIELEQADEAIGMDELPLPAIRRKKRSSILVGLRMVRDGRGDAFVSAGNTGAVMAASTIVLRRLQGVDRPALAALLPTSQGPVVLLDVGANLEVRVAHLEQFAVMGSCFHRSVCGVESPRVALLSIGEEEVKGNEVLRTVHRHLKEGPVNFVGNVDGKDVFSGHAHVVVTDGFTGNAILKASESLLKELVQVFRNEIDSSPAAKLGYLFMGPMLRRLRRRIDYAEYGAVPLLGVDRPVFIGHGSSSPKAIRSAIRAAAAFAERRVNDAIEVRLNALAASTRDDAAAAEPVPRHVATGGAP